MEGAWRTRVRVVVVGDGGAVLVVGDRLPEVEVEGRRGNVTTPQVVGAFAPVGIEPLVLRTIDAATDDAERVETLVLLAGLRGDEPPGARWADRDEVPDVARLLDGLRPARQPWADPAWLPAAEQWLRSAVEASGAEVTGPVRQHKVWELSSVLRQPTTTGDVFLKATVDSPLFVPEAAVTALLAGLFPRHVPAPLAVDAERGWIATPDFGEELGWGAPLQDRRDALRQFAALQLESVEHVDALIAGGCLDRRPAWLGEQLRSWFGEETTRRWVKPGHAAALVGAVPRLRELCAELAGSPLPVTLLHGDMHMANVARRPGGGYLFFDWTDAGVSHPFVDMIAMTQERDEASRTALRETYLAEWADRADGARLARDWAVAEVLAGANQAVSYMSLGLSLREQADGPANGIFASYTEWWLVTVLRTLDRLDGTDRATGLQVAADQVAADRDGADQDAAD